MRYGLETVLKKDGKFYTEGYWNYHREIETELDLEAYVGQRIQTINEYLPSGNIRIYHVAAIETKAAPELASIISIPLIGEIYGISPHAVRDIKNGVTWKGV